MQDMNDMSQNNKNDEKKSKKKVAFIVQKTNTVNFFLLSLITTVGVMLALGLSLSAVKLMNSNETINTLISSQTGDDNKDKYIITYVESTGISNQTIGNNSLYISNATFFKGENGGQGEVIYFGGLLLTTKNTFENEYSKITYEVTIVNNTNSVKTFYGLNFDKSTNVKYTISGLNEGDVVKPGQSIKTYVTVEYAIPDSNNENSNNNSNNKFPQTIETSMEYSFESKENSIHIENAELYKTTNDGKGEIKYFEGLMLTTKNELKSEKSTITYKITIKNDSSEVKTYNGLEYNRDGNIKYKVSGINEGDKINPGATKVIYLVVEGNENVKYPVTVESSVEFNFSDFGVSTPGTGIYLTDQFPVSDEIGKKFDGNNYVYTFSLIVGRKTVGAYYEITAVPDAGNTLSQNYVKLYLEKNNQGVDLSYRTNGRVKVFSEYLNSENGAEGKVIYKGKITEEDANNGKIDFVMRMWVTEDLHLTEDKLNDYVNRKFSAKVNTYAAFIDK